MMNQKKLETVVGAFVLVGLIMIGVLLVSFGSVGSFFKSTYEITVEFDNASGIIKNSQVLYRGAKVGTVGDKPRIQEGGRYVELPLKIDDGINIPSNAEFQVGSYGLLGDRFVNVIPPSKESGKYLEPGARVQGMPASGFGEIAQQLKPVIQRLDVISAKLENDVFTDEFAKNFNSTVKGASDVMAKMDRMMEEAENGNGIVYTLLKDPKAAADLKETLSEMKMLSYNLRKKGVLFYSDVSGKEQEADSDGSKMMDQRKR